MKLPIYQIDAFAERPFTGNPAAVIPLETWLPDDLMQSIAQENNLAETAFVVSEGEQFRIRWFTPEVEVDLCGHATLASAHVLFSEFDLANNQLTFQSRSGPLTVQRLGQARYRMGFTAQVAVDIEVPTDLLVGLGREFDATQLRASLFNEDYLLILDSERTVADLNPDLNLLGKVRTRGIIVSAAGTEFDFVCRFFGPRVGVNEDAVTGSAFTKLVPYWAKELGKNQLQARQISARGGNVDCELDGDAVYLSGSAASFLSGEISLP
jgi:PhzF family phenazine biosynthesis protein